MYFSLEWGIYMWSTKELKRRAKAVLKKIYWRALWVSIVIAVAGGTNGWHGGGSSGSRNSGNNTYSNIHHSSSTDLNFILIGLFIVILVLVIALALRIFIGYHLEVGGRRYFVQSAQYKYNKECFGFAFSGQNYFGIVKTMLLKSVFNFLWYLLLIIPGIIKSYSYRMVPYILADNPNIGANRAIEISNEMTAGHKFDLFVLDLSFIGWYLLGLVAFVIGILFVLPYANATEAELYLVLRKNALENHICSYEELLLNKPISDNNFYI